MQTTIRVIADLPSDGRDALKRVLAELIDEIPGVRELSPVEPHSRGGFLLYLDFPDPDCAAVLDFLHANGWLPCF